LKEVQVERRRQENQTSITPPTRAGADRRKKTVFEELPSDKGRRELKEREERGRERGGENDIRSAAAGTFGCSAAVELLKKPRRLEQNTGL